ncbi:Uma2 family endonuclease [Kribbella sp. NBC_01245]|uniref:Uma2 family endonuclease n=1 Tax=Kribbella sp. NBC_01245 TaxID=2903578 RepID=UPI002E2D3203|nr:Uma2 family endonuclease [Kribbella sp. NBC_01245]
MHTPPPSDIAPPIADPAGNGAYYELVDGMRIVTPTPLPEHQRAVAQMFRWLDRNLPAELELFTSPLSYRPTYGRSLLPDLMVLHRTDVGLLYIDKPPLLLVEVVSSVTRSSDLLLKRSLYKEAGVPSYWLFDPAAEELTVLELENDTYVERANVKGQDAFKTTTPYDIRLVPADLVR